MRDRAPQLDALGPRDLILIYVESYGRSSHDNPLYAQTHRDTLRKAQDKIAQAGMAMRSGWARAPMVGRAKLVDTWLCRLWPVAGHPIALPRASGQPAPDLVSFRSPSRAA